MVLAHLSAAPLPDPQRDKNLRIDFNIRNSEGDDGIDLRPGAEEDLPSAF
jgi:hypothetical protein